MLSKLRYVGNKVEEGGGAARECEYDGVCRGGKQLSVVTEPIYCVNLSIDSMLKVLLALYSTKSCQSSSFALSRTLYKLCKQVTMPQAMSCTLEAYLKV